MKKAITFLTIILLTSCSNNDDNEKKNPNNSKLLISKIEYFNDSSELMETQIFTYNSDNYISKIENIKNGNVEEITNYIYENKKLVKQISPGNSSSEIYTHDYVYSDGFLIYSKELNIGGLVTTYTYSYNDEGYLKIKKSDYRNENIEYFYSNNNVSKIVLSQTSYQRTNVYEYTNTVDYLAVIFPKEYYKIYRLSDFNTAKESYSNGSIYTYEYTYNEYEFPIQITKKEDGVIRSVEKIHYK